MSLAIHIFPRLLSVLACDLAQDLEGKILQGVQPFNRKYDVPCSVE